MEDEKKELSTEVKTVLHGEVLGPEDESYDAKKKSKEERVNDFKERMDRNAYYNQQYSQNPFAQNQEAWHHQMSGLYPRNIFGGCMIHVPGIFGICKNCGKY